MENTIYHDAYIDERVTTYGHIQRCHNSIGGEAKVEHCLFYIY